MSDIEYKTPDIFSGEQRSVGGDRRTSFYNELGTTYDEHGEAVDMSESDEFIVRKLSYSTKKSSSNSSKKNK